VSEGRWRISVTAPDWGEDHLTLDAIVAYVDDELGPGPFSRATRHVAHCDECRAQVAAQRQARAALRTAGGPRLPSSLLSALRSIPEHADLPGAPADLAVSPEGQLVYRPEPPTRPTRRSRDVPPGSGLRTRSAALPPMLPATLPAILPVSLSRVALTAPAAPAGVLDPAATDTLLTETLLTDTTPVDAAPTAEPLAGKSTEHGRRPVPRRIRFGTGVAMSGLALGALAFGVTAASPTVPAPSTERGVLGGSVLGGAAGLAGSPLLSPSGLVDARLQLGAARIDPARAGLRELPRTLGSLRGLW
jgi:anti-sigma factor RsiW